MKVRHWALPALALIIAVAGCGKANNKPEPDKSSAPAYTFEVASKYAAEVQLDPTHTEQVELTLGKPLSVTAYTADHPKFCEMPTPDADTAVPFYLSMVNTSAKQANGVMIGFDVTLAVDTVKAGHYAGFTIQSDDLKRCDEPYPTRGATTNGLFLSHAPEAWESYSPTDTPTTIGQNLKAYGYFGLTSGGNGPTPPPESLFLRLSPPNQQSRLHYTITSLTAQHGKAGYIVEGPDKGVYYVSLGKATPCDTSFAGTTAFKCGATLP